MCGIAGQIGYHENMRQMSAVMTQMSESIASRGPDASGLYVDDRAFLVHRRLAVIDPDNGAQPMSYGDLTLVYNGELYNTQELRRGLMERGVEFTGHSDTEVVLRAYAEYGDECVKLFNGIFAFAVWDSRRRRLFLARDRIGVKPLFYSRTRDGIVFASEIKALLKHPQVRPVIDESGIADIMLIGPAKRVGSGVFRDISEIPPANFAVLTDEGLTLTEYWKVHAKPHTESFEETSAHIRELLTDAIKRQLVSDVPLCCFLSGGLDSSVISAVAAEEFRKQGRRLSTWSIDYRDNHRNFRASSFQPDEDAPWIVRMAEHIGSQHTNVILDTPALADALEDSTRARDLPGMADVDSSLYLFCREIRKRFPVALSGECADEVLGGYPWYHRRELLFYDGFPWSTAVPERAALMKRPMSGKEAEEYVRQSYNKCISRTEYLDSDSAGERRMREMFMLNMDYFMATLLDDSVTKVKPQMGSNSRTENVRFVLVNTNKTSGTHSRGVARLFVSVYLIVGMPGKRSLRLVLGENYRRCAVLYHIQHMRNYILVKLTACHAFQLPNDNVRGQGVTVAAPAGHGVIGVRNADYTGNQRNIVPRKPLAVALSVDALMVVSRAVRNALYRRVVL